MKTFLLVLISLPFSILSFGQINKASWLLGGNGTYSSHKNDYVMPEKDKNLQLNPDIGYFPFNKFAIGVRAGYTYNQQTGEAVNGHFKQSYRYINLGPFIRYYLLAKSKKLNVFGDASYYYGWVKNKNLGGYSKERRSGYSLGAGPAWFFTPHTALELTVNYKNADESFYTSSGIYINVGFQIHL